MKCLAAFYMMERAGLIFNRDKFRLAEVIYIPLDGVFSDYMTAWKQVLDMVEIAKGRLLCSGFHHIEKIEIYSLGSSEAYPFRQ